MHSGNFAVVSIISKQASYSFFCGSVYLNRYLYVWFNVTFRECLFVTELYAHFYKTVPLKSEGLDVGSDDHQSVAF